MRTRAALMLLVFASIAHAQPARTQVRFAGPPGMQVRWLFKTADGKETFSDPPLIAPARFNFQQGGVYRLKLSHLRGHPGLEVYPTLEVPVPGPAAREFLTHNAALLEIRDEDLREAADGKQVTRAIFLPTAEGRPPGPGTILLILRLGDVVLEK